MSDTPRILNTRIMLRSDETSNWTANNPKLAKGELGLEFTTSGEVKIKVGDGATNWNALDYFAPSTVITRSVSPVASDYNYAVGSLWVNQTSNSVFVLTSVSGTTAVWVNLTDASEIINGNATADSTAGLNILTNVVADDMTITPKYKTLANGSNVSVTSSGSTISISATDTGAVSASLPTTTAGDNLITSVTYDATNRALILTRGGKAFAGITQDASNPADADVISNIVQDGTNIKVTKAKSAEVSVVSDNGTNVNQGLVTAVVKGAGSHQINVTHGITYVASGSAFGTASDTKLPTEKAVSDYVATQIAANDAMHFRGTLGTSGATVSVLPANAIDGDTYKVITSNTYYQSTGSTTGTGEKASLGDLFIRAEDSWTYVPSGNDGNVFHSSALTDSSVIVGGDGDDIESLPNGTLGQVLKMQNVQVGDATVLKPSWGTDNNTEYSAGNGINVASNVISLKTPGSITQTSSNSATASSHTHSLTMTKNWLSSNLNTDTDVLVLFGGYADGTWTQ